MVKSVRNLSKTLAISLLVIVALGVLVGYAISAPVAKAEEKGPATDHLIYKAVPLDNVPEAIGKTIDAYIFGLRSSQIKALQGKSGVTIYTAPAGITDFLLNPAPVYTTTLDGVLSKDQAAAKLGVPAAAITYIEVNQTSKKTYVELGAYPGKGINPFAFQPIRFAINYLIDRNYIVNNIYGGYAAAMYAPYSYYDPMYSVVADIVAKYKFEYSPAQANEIISKVLTAVGAKNQNGMWYYDGKPITIKFIIRTEDERKDLGDMLATALDKLGFTVNRMYMTFGEAITKVYFTNPTDLEWQIYTEGWGKGGLTKWDPYTLAQFTAPWYGWMPGIQQPGWWQYKNATLDNYTKALVLGKFKSKDEFIDLTRKAMEIALQESVRVWIATTMDGFPAVSDLKGVTGDLGAGLRSIYNAREWYIPGKDTLTIGHLHIWTARTVWNIFGGFSDVYSVDIERQTYDPFDWTNPFNGEPIPFRVTWTVKTAGPTGKMTVPTDAIIWNATEDKWVNVSSGTKATSEVIFDLSKLVGTKWHDNITITCADVLATWAEWFEITYDPQKSQIEGSIASTAKPTLDLIKGLQILPGHKLAVYLDFWHFDPNYIADMAVMNVVNPAGLILAQDYLVFTKQTYAFSDSRSEEAKIPQLSLVLPDHAAAIEDVVKNWLSSGYFPANVFTVNGKLLMSKSEWTQRLNAIVKWIDTYHNAWISDGPYKLVKFDKDQQVAELEAFRDPTYPFTPGTWYFGMPKPVKITNVFVPVISPGDAATAVVSVTGEPPIHVKYILRDPIKNKIIATGDAVQSSPTSFTIQFTPDITSKLSEYSAYELTVLAFSDKVAMPDQVVTSLTTGAALSKKLGEISSSVSSQISNVTSQINSITSQINSITSQIGTLSGQLQSVGQLATQIGKLATAIGTLGNTMQTLQSTESALASKVDSVNNAVQNLQTTQSTLSTQLTTATKSVESLSNGLALVEGLLVLTIILQIVAIYLVYKKK